MKLFVCSIALCLVTTLLISCSEEEPAPFEISSTSFQANGELPAAYSCEGKPFGAGIAPELHWSKGPEGTLSYAIVFKDLTIIESAPQFAFHWMLWNIPASITQMPEGLSDGQFPAEMGGSAEQYQAGPSGKKVYLGPCPSWMSFCDNGATPLATDTYSFTLYAFNQAVLTPPVADTSVHPNYVGQVDAWFESIAIAKTEIQCTSAAKPNEFGGCPATE